MTTRVDDNAAGDDDLRARFREVRTAAQSRGEPTRLLALATRHRRARARARTTARIAAAVVAVAGLGLTVAAASASPGPEGEVATDQSTTEGVPTDAPLAVLLADGSVARVLPGDEPEVVAPAGLGIREIARGRSPHELLVVTGGEQTGACDVGSIGWLDEGDVEEIAQGGGPVLSPDGSRLAYVQARSTGSGSCDGADVVVRELDTGEERRWGATEMSAENVNDLAPTSRLTWSPDSTALSFGTYDGYLNLLSVERAGTSVADGVRTRDDRPGVQIPFWARTGALHVVDVGGGEQNRSSPFVIVDPETGSTVRTVTETSGGKTIAAISDDGQIVYAISGLRGEVERFREGQWTKVDLDGVRSLITLA